MYTCKKSRTFKNEIQLISINTIIFSRYSENCNNIIFYFDMEKNNVETEFVILTVDCSTLIEGETKAHIFP